MPPLFDPQSMKIALALEKIVHDAIQVVEAQMDHLKLPPSLREPMWQAICGRAMAKAIESAEQDKI